MTGILIGVLVVSMSVFMLEISLLRIFSVVLWYHYAFVVVSMALLGLGFGGLTVAALRDKVRAIGSASDALALIASVLSGSVVISTVYIVEKSATESLLIYIVPSIIPFVAAGAFLSVVFDANTVQSNRIYAADLFGVATGTLSVVLFLRLFGAIDTALLVAVLTSLVAVGFSRKSPRKWVRRASIVTLCVSCGLFVLNLRSGWIDISFEKDGQYSLGKTIVSHLRNSRQKAEVVMTRWDFFSRTDVVAEESAKSMWIYTDGGAGAEMIRFDGRDLDQVSFLKDQTCFLPFSWGDRERALIIGAGGGKDLLLALIGGCTSITGVEISPGVVDAVERFSDYNGDIFHNKNVSVYTGDGRNFVRRSKDTYNIIFLSLIFSQAADLTGLTLTENYVYTEEAFEDYLSHLSPDGKIALVLHNQDKLLKAANTALAVLTRQGMSLDEALDHIVIFNGEMAKKRPEIIFMPLLIVKKSPFSDGEARGILDAAKEEGIPPLYVPHRYEVGPYGRLSRSGLSLKAFISSSEINIKPATDDSPYFYNAERGIPKQLKRLLWVTLIMAGAVLARALLPGRQAKKTRGRRIGGGLFVIYFSLLGVGFMLVELVLMQRFILFLGYPTLTFALLIFSLLLPGGVGSYLGRSFKGRKAAGVTAGCSLMAAVIIVAYTLGLSGVFAAFLGGGLPLRSSITVALVAPLGFLMGVPFPIGLRLLKDSWAGAVPMMWGVNAIMSVLGSILALVIGILVGASWALIIAAAMYLGVFMLCRCTTICSVTGESEISS